jgi:diacylglycerol kinase (ATP)
MSAPVEKVAVLTNPAAGRSRHQRLLPHVLELLRADGRTVTLLRARDAAESERASREAVAAGVGALVVVGGDGTLHAALQAVADTKVALGVVPCGTGNDFAEALGVPGDPLAAARATAAALDTGATSGVDLARVTDAAGATRWYGTVLAAGFDAVVNERANLMRWPRGDRRYDLAIVLELIRLRARRYVLRLDGRELERDAVLVAVGNTTSYGGGMRICPQADPTDGLLDVIVGGRFTRPALMRIKPKVYRGSHVRHPLVETFRARTVELAAEGITTYTDGERGLPLPVTVTAVAGALRVLSG